MEKMTSTEQEGTFWNTKNIPHPYHSGGYVLHQFVKTHQLQTSSYDNYLLIQLLSREGVNIERRG